MATYRMYVTHLDRDEREKFNASLEPKEYARRERARLFKAFSSSSTETSSD